MGKDDLLKIWGYLEVLKNYYRDRAANAAREHTEESNTTIIELFRASVEIGDIQGRIDDAVERLENSERQSQEQSQ